MIVSSTIIYRIVDAIKAKFGITNLKLYIENQGLDVLRGTCSKFPYRSNDPSEPSLTQDSQIIGDKMREILQERCEIAGVEIIGMELMELSYHPEVAQGLLQI